MILKDQYRLGKIRRGDISSFEKLFHAHYQGMFAYAMSLLHRTEIAEEVVQDVFYNVWKNRESIRIQSNWHSYLFRSVYNNSMMYLRKQQREQPLAGEFLQDQVAPGDDPLQALQAEELSRVIGSVLESLPERCRQIFLMNRQEGLKYREIAMQLGISLKTVEAHMGKALKALRITLEKHGQL